MEGDIIEFGDLPTDDPTLEDGAVMVFRSTAINYLVEIALGQLGHAGEELPAHLLWHGARQAVLEIIGNDPNPSAPVLWDEQHRKMAANILQHLRKSTGIDYNRYRLNLFLSMIYGNTLVVIYGIGRDIH